MTTGRLPFSGGSVGSFVNHISPRCGLSMCKFLLIQGESLLGELSPGSLLCNLFVAQAVVIGGDIGFQRRSPLFPRLFQKQLVQDGGLRAELSRACLLVQVSQTLRREGECAAPLNA